MFGANWCAPCRVELRQLRQIAELAFPDKLRIAWIEPSRFASSAAAAAQIDSMPVAEARGQFARLPGGNAGLPVSAMLTADGRVCAVFRGPLTSAGIARLRSDCARN